MLQSLGLGKLPLALGHWKEPGGTVGPTVVVVATVVVPHDTMLGLTQIFVTGSKTLFPGQFCSSYQKKGASSIFFNMFFYVFTVRNGWLAMQMM